MRSRIFIPVCLAALTGCRELKARVDNTSVNVSSPGCFGAIGVGDSLQMRAVVASRNWTHYTSDDNPKSFHWSVRPDRNRGGAADISDRGLLVARAAGTLRVYAVSIGDSDRTQVTVVPRVTWRGVSPRDTTIQTGDTLTLRIDADVEGGRWYQYARWEMPRYSYDNPALITRVERDPDDRTPLDTRLFPIVAERPGEARIAMCAVGNRADTFVVRITGERIRQNRDVPPVVRLTPPETTVFAGERFHVPARLINSRLRNGPWRWQVAYGDGKVDTGTVMNGSETSAWGTTISLGYNHTHVYNTVGTYTLTMTVTDSAGRKGTAQRRIHAIGYEYSAEAFPGQEEKVVRLGGGSRTFPIAIYGQHPHWLARDDPAFARVPLIKIGRTPWIYDRAAGITIEHRDANGDNRTDQVLHVDIRALMRNGDLRVGRNHLVITGAITHGAYEGQEVDFTPFRAVATVDVVR